MASSQYSHKKVWWQTDTHQSSQYSYSVLSMKIDQSTFSLSWCVIQCWIIRVWLVTDRQTDTHQPQLVLSSGLLSVGMWLNARLSAVNQRRVTCDRQTDRQTDRHAPARACVVVRPPVCWYVTRCSSLRSESTERATQSNRPVRGTRTRTAGTGRPSVGVDADRSCCAERGEVTTSWHESSWTIPTTTH